MVEPLKGVRVLDLSRVLAGPYCTMLMGDLGAEVIKVERPKTGDETRAWGPPFAGGESAYYLCINRNKKSITINLQTQKGKDITKALVKISDVLVENFLPGTMERLGLGYQVLKEINPGLIYCSITGFGQDGPLKHMPGYDVLVSAYGGLMSITGEQDGNPVKVGVAITDVATGILAYGSIVTALFVRQKTGRGQRIDLSLLETQVSALVNMASSYLVGGVIPRRWGTAHEAIVPYQAFKAKDKFIVITIGNDKLWAKFCNAIGCQDLVDNPKFKTNPLRVKNRTELIQILGEVIEKKTCKEWLEIFSRESIPAAPINTIDEVFADPQVLHRQMLVEIDHPTIGKLKMTGLPAKYSDTKPSIRLAPPLLGQHTQEILKDLLGYTDEQIKQLKEENVI
jgi:crotonobetainyl-CoA:carnitine CoA-transferase CaiB-like acyl-CoA transferase